MPIVDQFGRPISGTTTPEELEKTFEDSKKTVEDNTKAMSEGMEKMQASFEKMLDRTNKKMLDQYSASNESFRRMADLIGQGISTTLQKSLQRSLPSSMSSMQPMFGKIGEEFGGVIGKSLMGMLSANPIVGMIGATVGKLVIGEVQMQMEGYRMIGAKAAPVATAGRLQDVDFEKIGVGYSKAIREISIATGATADEVASLADRLSKVGVGFLDGGQKQAQFALAAERVMNLSKGTAEALQIETIEKYGDTLESARRQIESIRDAQKEFIVANWQTNSSIAKTLSSGQVLSDLLGQISASARNSGASLEGMNSVAITLVKTMAGGAQGQMFRPGQMGEVGANIMQNLMPSMTGTLQEEAQRSKLDAFLMKQTGMGRQVARRIKSNAPSDLKGGDEDFLFNMMQQNFVLGGKKNAAQVALGKMAGTSALVEKFGMKAAMAAMEQHGMSPAATYATNRVYSELTDRMKKQGMDVNDPRQLTKAFMQYQREAQTDPKAKEMLKAAGLNEEMLKTASKQGDAMRSAMEKTADKLAEVREYLQGTYWDRWKDSTAAVFGLDTKNASSVGVLGKILNPLSMASGVFSAFSNRGNEAGATQEAQQMEAFRQDIAKGNGGQEGPMVSSQTVVLSRNTAKASQFDLATRDKNVLPN